MQSHNAPQFPVRWPAVSHEIMRTSKREERFRHISEFFAEVIFV